MCDRERVVLREVEVRGRERGGATGAGLDE